MAKGLNPLVWVVGTLCRKGDFRNLLDSFFQQAYPNKRLLVVENGAAVNYTAGSAAHARIVSPPGAAAARNAALAHLGHPRGQLLAFFDADDYYAPGYLDEAVAALREWPIVGKRVHYVRYSDGLYLYRRGEGQREVNRVHGATIALRLADRHVLFPHLEYGEDHAWCDLSRAAGFRIYATSEQNYVYRRTGQHHAWPASEAVAKFHYGACERFSLAADASCARRRFVLGEAYAPTEGGLFTAPWGGASVAR